MENTPAMIDQINKCFDLTIKLYDSNVELLPKNQVHIKSQIYNDLVEKTENQYGSEVLQFSISPTDYMKYKNGKYSSIIKGDSGFQSHQGFEAVKIVNIVDSVFLEIDRYYTNYMLSEFQNLTNQIFSSINYVQCNILNSINDLQSNLVNHSLDLKKQEHVDDLFSFQDFFNEINDEFGDISCSTIRSSAYINNIISIRTQIYKNYNYFIGNLQSWVPFISNQYYSGQYINGNINLNALNNDYFLCRQAINCYMITLVYEYIIAGNIDDRSCQRIISKVEGFLIKFREVDTNIKNALYQRDEANKSWNWLYWQEDRLNESNAIRWLLNQINNDPDFEITKIKELFNKGKEVLNDIQFIEHCELDDNA